MNAAIEQLQDMTTAANQEHMNLKEESNMKTKNQISKWINGNTTVKMVAGLALGAMLMTAIALPSNAFADTPKRPMTSEEQLVIMAEIEDGFYDTVALTPEQQLMVRAEIEDGDFGTVSLTSEQQLVVRAEIEDAADDTGFLTTEQLLTVRAEIEDGAYDTGFLTPEQQLVVRAEIEDGALGFEDYKRDQVGVSRTGAVGVLQAILSHDEGSVFLAEEWLQIIAEIEDAV